MISPSSNPPASKVKRIAAGTVCPFPGWFLTRGPVKTWIHFVNDKRPFLLDNFGHYHPDQDEAPADLPAPASEEYETAKKVCAVLRDIVTIDENQQWDLLVGGVAQLRAVLSAPQNPTTESRNMTDDEKRMTHDFVLSQFAHPITDEAIAREAAEHIRLNNEMVRGGYDSRHTTESIILDTIQRARQATSSQQKEAGK